MQWGLEAGKLPALIPYGAIVEAECSKVGFSPCLALAIAWRETIRGQVGGKWVASKVVSGDGGHGLYQLTSSWPSNWIDAAANTAYALSHFLIPGMAYFAGKGMRGDALASCIAAGFNSGDITAWDNHTAYGNVDIGTANHDYAADVVAQYHRLLSGQWPH